MSRRRCQSCCQRSALPEDDLCSACVRSRDALRRWTPPPRSNRVAALPQEGSAAEAALFERSGLPAPPSSALDEATLTQLRSRLRLPPEPAFD